MKKLALLLGLLLPSASADVGYVETLERSPFEGTYCVGFGALAAIGARARSSGAPLIFVLIDRDRYHELRAEQIAKTGSAQMPADGIYMVPDIERETLAQQKILEYGWRWMSERIEEGSASADWTIVSQVLAQRCEDDRGGRR